MSNDGNTSNSHVFTTSLFSKACGSRTSGKPVRSVTGKEFGRRNEEESRKSGSVCVILCRFGAGVLLGGSGGGLFLHSLGPRRVVVLVLNVYVLVLDVCI